MERESFVFYKSFYEAIRLQNKEVQADIYNAVAEYALYGREPEKNSPALSMFILIKPQIDANNTKYANGKKGAEYGVMGGRPKNKKPLKNPLGVSSKNPKKTPNVNENVNVNENDKKTLCNADANAQFERLWKIYPLKRGKAQVSEANKRRLLDIGFDELERAISRYKADLANETWRKPQNGSTFFNSGYVDYLDENYTKPPKSVDETKKNKFANFEQREWDFEAIEEARNRELEG